VYTFAFQLSLLLSNESENKKIEDKVTIDGYYELAHTTALQITEAIYILS
jgi:hypothetical protein